MTFGTSLVIGCDPVSCESITGGQYVELETVRIFWGIFETYGADISQVGYTSLFIIVIHNSMEKSLSWRSTGSSASQEIPRILWDPNVHYVFATFRHLSQFWAR